MRDASNLCGGRELDAFQLLFNVETYLRLLVRWELRGRHPADWKGVLPNGLLKSVRLRITQERELSVLDVYKHGELSYLLLSELKDIILGPLWPAFKRDFPPQDILKADFKRLIAIRNKVAHFRPVTERDSRVIRRFAEDLFDWTRSYTNLRESMEFDSYAKHFPDACKSALDRLAAFPSTASVKTAHASHHLVLHIELTNATLNPKALLIALDGNEGVLTFVRIGTNAERIECYFPKDVADNRVSSTLDDFSTAFGRNESDTRILDIDSEFEVALRETILTWDVVWPFGYASA